MFSRSYIFTDRCATCNQMSAVRFNENMLPTGPKTGFLLGALRLVNAASPRNIDQKKISSGTQGSLILSFDN